MKKYIEKYERISLDKILKVLFKLSTKVTINLLNSLFNENFRV